MPSRAVIAHRLHGRVRLRVAGQRGDFAYFEHVRTTLAESSLVEQVSTNAMTGSVLIFHRGETHEVLEFAENRSLFELERDLTSKQSHLVQIRRAIGAADAELRGRTRGQVSIASAAVYALLAGAAFQTARGQILPAAAAMLAQALNLTFDAAAADLTREVEQRSNQPSSQGSGEA